MPEYVENVLHQVQHQTPTAPENQPYKHMVPKYGAKIQYEDIKEGKPILSK